MQLESKKPARKIIYNLVKKANRRKFEPPFNRAYGDKFEDLLIYE